MLKSLVMAMVLSLTSFSAFAADAAKGETLYKACISCHGQSGEGNAAMKAPRIGGQYDWYIVSQLELFMNGDRKNPAMMPFIKKLSKKDFEDLAAYISKL